VLVKALVTKGAFAFAFFEVFAVLRSQGGAVIIEQFVLFLLGLHPKRTGAHKVRAHATFGTSSADIK